MPMRQAVLSLRAWSLDTTHVGQAVKRLSFTRFKAVVVGVFLGVTMDPAGPEGASEAQKALQF